MRNVKPCARLGCGRAHRAARHPGGHDYTLLGALRGPHKRTGAHIVTLTESSETFSLFQQSGTEPLYD
jgi:hypothetical protein